KCVYLGNDGGVVCLPDVILATAIQSIGVAMDPVRCAIIIGPLRKCSRRSEKRLILRPCRGFQFCEHERQGTFLGTGEGGHIPQEYTLWDIFGRAIQQIAYMADL